MPLKKRSMATQPQLRNKKSTGNMFTSDPLPGHNTHPAASNLNADVVTTTQSAKKPSNKPRYSHRLKKLNDSTYIELPDGKRKFKRRDLLAYSPYSEIKTSRAFHLTCIILLALATIWIFYSISLTLPHPNIPPR